MMNPRPGLLCIVLAAAGCGPGGPAGSTGTDGGSGSTSETTSDSSTSATATTQGSDSASGSGTGEACTEPAAYFVPGCGDASPGDASVEAGCYVPCDESTPCDSGTCVTAWIDPCHGSPCGVCGGQQGLCLEGLPTGSECESDDQCLSGVCWDFNDYDECCFGTVCSGTCETNQDCIDLAAAAGADYPDQAACGADGRCDLVSTGLGSFACANNHMCG